MYSSIDVDNTKNNLMYLKGIEKGFTMSINNRNSFEKIRKIKEEIEKIEKDLQEREQNTMNDEENNKNNLYIINKNIISLTRENNTLKNKIRGYQKNYKYQNRVYVKRLLNQLEIIDNNLSKYVQLRDNIRQKNNYKDNFTNNSKSDFLNNFSNSVAVNTVNNSDNDGIDNSIYNSVDNRTDNIRNAISTNISNDVTNNYINNDQGNYRSSIGNLINYTNTNNNLNNESSNFARDAYIKKHIIDKLKINKSNDLMNKSADEQIYNDERKDIEINNHMYIKNNIKNDNDRYTNNDSDTDNNSNKYFVDRTSSIRKYDKNINTNTAITNHKDLIITALLNIVESL